MKPSLPFHPFYLFLSLPISWSWHLIFFLKGGPEDYFGAHVSDTPRIDQQHVQQPCPLELWNVIPMTCLETPAHPSTVRLQQHLRHVALRVCHWHGFMLLAREPFSFLLRTVFLFLTQSFTSVALRVSLAIWDSDIGGDGWGSWAKCACM